MTAEARSNAVIVWAGWLGVAVFLQTGPQTILQQTQSLLQATTGGVLSALPTFSRLSPEEPSRDPTPEGEQLAQLQAENRELRRMVADLQAQQSDREKHQQLPLQTDRQLLTVSRQSARVLGRKGDPLSANLQLLIALGTAHGLHETDLVLSGEGLLIDAGESAMLHPDQLVTAGRSLLGRTARVGRQTALVQPLTDSSFRMAIRIYRRSPLGPVEGPAGVLAGTGTGCRIDEVPATEAVAVGDDVYTDPVSSPTNVPVYCGRITKVDVLPTAPHWSIDMAPVHSPTRLPPVVQVLKSTLHPR